tara:strand:- start:234 stop:416 length:183 start_codon:yes stop_codon:yes gene_type:complete
MEIKRYSSINLLVEEMNKDLFSVDINNSTDEVSLLFRQLTNHDFLSVCKKIDTNKWKKAN